MHRLARLPAWVYLAALAAALVGWGLAPRSVAPVNPEALEALKSIVALCDRATDPAAPDAARCEDVRYVVQWCSTRGKEMCELDKVYASMVALGFRLPPLHPQRN